MIFPNKNRHFFIIFIFSLLLITAGQLRRSLPAALASGSTPINQDESEGSSPLPDSSEGLATYAERCATCHGEFGQGDGELASGLPNPPASHADAEFIRSAVPNDLFTTITDGRIDKGMPPFGPASSNPLSESQRWSAIAAIYALGTAQESIEQGREEYVQSCISCHGPTGQGDGPDSATLSAPLTDIGTAAYWSSISNKDVFDRLRENDHEGAHDFELTDDVLWSTIDHMRTFSYQFVDALAAFRPIESGTITGQIINGSPEGDVVSDGLVTLRGFTPELQMSVDLSSPIDGEGRFVFEVTDVPPDLFYRVSTDYGEIDFSSDFGQLTPLNPVIELPITVFEKTSNPDAISIDQLHVILDFGQGIMNVSEFYVAGNDEAAVFAGETGKPSDGTFKITLPAGAQDVIFQRGFGGVDSFIPANEVISTADGWADTIPIRPGSGTVNLLVQYSLPYEDESTISHSINYPTSAINLVIPDAGVDLTNGSEWTDTGQRAMGPGAVSTFGQIALPAGQELAISLEGKPRSAAPEPADVLSENSTEIIVGAAVAAAVLIFAAVVLRRWLSAPAVAADRQILMEEIALLDEAYEAGEISQEAYQREREELKAELVAVWNEQNPES